MYKLQCILSVYFFSVYYQRTTDVLCKRNRYFILAAILYVIIILILSWSCTCDWRVLLCAHACMEWLCLGTHAQRCVYGSVCVHTPCMGCQEYGIHYSHVTIHDPLIHHSRWLHGVRTVFLSLLFLSLLIINFCRQINFHCTLIIIYSLRFHIECVLVA